MGGRLIIYFHYDPRGQADSACRFAVQALCAQAKTILFVENGRLDKDSLAWAQGMGLRVLERENKGYDVGAYRDALLSLGREALDLYEEIVLMNYTLAGPVCPLGDMFSAMQKRRELDFWGLSRHYAMRSRRFGGIRGVVPEHIQSHFIAVRPRMYEAFWRYWMAMPAVNSYEQSIARHEVRFTSYFSDKGFRWDTFVPGQDWRGVFVNPIMACPRDLIRRYGCPFFKRRSFFTPFADELRRTDGLAAVQLYEYLNQETDYPVDQLIASLLPVQPLGEMARNLHWRYLLPGPNEGREPCCLAASELVSGAALEAGQVYTLEPTPGPLSGTVGYYAGASAWTGSEQARAAALFAAHPLLGVLVPDMPLYGPVEQALAQRWRRDYAYVRQKALDLGVDVPIDPSSPPPLPLTGNILVRGEAFPDGLPPLRCAADWWLIPLCAQQNGYATAAVVAMTQATACADLLSVCRGDSRSPVLAARALARACKHRLLHHKEECP